MRGGWLFEAKARPVRQMHLALRKLGFSGPEILALPEGMAAGYLAAAVSRDKDERDGVRQVPKTYKVRRRGKNHGG